MKCPKCKKELEEIDIEIEDAKSKAKSWQCPKCNYLNVDEKSLKKIVKEIKAVERSKKSI